MSSKAIAEFIGTFILVFFGVGSAVLMGDQIGFHGIAMAFGFSIVAAAYGFGAISGAQLNPAVSLGFLTSGRMGMSDFVTYCIAQILGAVAAAAVVLMIASGKADYSLAENGLGQNGYGAGYNGGYSMLAALIFEFVATFLFVTVILGATQSDAPVGFGGLAIGLTLAGIHLVGIDVTGVSVNPARSIGPALFAGGQALADLWLFILAPLAGGLLAGLLHGAGITRSPHVKPQG
ncbi:aquaporin [Paracoccus sp. Z330]|uniref:Aquaporin n=1 Tax=Paracoccus onchidii TaxID=3017813 RepID=A0ABT4ZIQ0_9RHOB|nr:aquaporin [Paracoccus onchidii]MDB6179196.1 aquaporin [Paracoccus onchidii]